MRNPETNKYDYGHALLVAGQFGCMGCAILAARAAMRAGCGLLTALLPKKCITPMQVACPEAMTVPDNCNERITNITPNQMKRYNAIAIGPGIGTHPSTINVLKTIIHHASPAQQLILDADALNIIALHMPDFWKAKPFVGRLAPILTPHAGEYERLFRHYNPQKVATINNIVLVFKGHHTHVYAPDGEIYTNFTGNAGMATAGSGDVLTGILLGLAAQQWCNPDPFQVACTGVRIHGESGDCATTRQSEASLIASDLVENLKYVDL